MEHSIQEVARLTGTTSRTLRHYAQIGLLEPHRIGHNGYRYYNTENLIRLQRILLLRELGLGLPQIAQILASQAHEATALETHLALLREEQDRISRQITAVQHTIISLQGSVKLMAQNMFDGFDHTIHQEEVEERWGKDAYARSDTWWRRLGDEGQTSMKERLKELNARWIQAAHDPSVTPDSLPAQDLAQRHVGWLTSVPGTPAADPAVDTAGYIIGLAQMYVADERFAANYGGVKGAKFVRDALTHYVASLK
ncbi:MerR family transcriptional regulator [Arthrobacter sp. MYb227]|uniref:MerR family transcriptional regulator n=1 Tax=Arthrobacter sp. MYb227 TaxID=1848601 RepID=UPI000CFBAA30|nr:TipAS antibiotic-recognition domain-containing protein [Arthrobacter sp. MYb227]PQZ88181.1 MerR family transcriptional regulator [Arthrobacter sp. MYb227]